MIIQRPTHSVLFRNLYTTTAEVKPIYIYICIALYYSLFDMPFFFFFFFKTASGHSGAILCMEICGTNCSLPELARVVVNLHCEFFRCLRVFFGPLEQAVMVFNVREPSYHPFLFPAILMYTHTQEVYDMCLRKCDVNWHHYWTVVGGWARAWRDEAG